MKRTRRSTTPVEAWVGQLGHSPASDQPIHTELVYLSILTLKNLRVTPLMIVQGSFVEIIEDSGRKVRLPKNQNHLFHLTLISEAKHVGNAVAITFLASPTDCLHPQTPLRNHIPQTDLLSMGRLHNPDGETTIVR